MSIELVVVHPFADYAIGDRIADPEQIQTILSSNPAAVIKVQAAGAVQNPAPDVPQERTP